MEKQDIKNIVKKILNNVFFIRVSSIILFFILFVLIKNSIINNIEFVSNFMCETNWNIIITLATIFLGIVAVISSNIINKRQIASTVVTGNRMDWIKRFRYLISTYLAKVNYYEDKNFNISEDLKQLYELESEIKIHLNVFGTYDEIICNYISRLNFSHSSICHWISIRDAEHLTADEVIEMLIYIYKHYNIQIEDLISGYTSAVDIEVFIKDNFKELYQKSCKILLSLKNSWIKDIKNLSELILIYSQIYLKTEWDRVKKEAISAKKFNFDKKFKDYLLLKRDKIIELENLLEDYT